jgi:transposase-like protein
MEDRQRRTRRQFTEEFKGDAVDLVRTTGHPIAWEQQHATISPLPSTTAA